jgi:hypothetical protein
MLAFDDHAGVGDHLQVSAPGLAFAGEVITQEHRIGNV